jgi:DNA-directed RNA polymerase subunit RPC12/RpoP
MPRILYLCLKCNEETKKFYRSSNNILNKIDCKCGGELLRQLSSPNQRSKIVVDNGVQTKAVEIDREIVEIIEDREKADLKKRGDSVIEELK